MQTRSAFVICRLMKTMVTSRWKECFPESRSWWPSDGGGATEFIEHEREGLIVEPEPQAIAEALDSLYADRARARAMGERGQEKLKAHESLVATRRREPDRRSAVGQKAC